MVIPVIPMPQSFFRASVALMPICLASSARVMASCMRMRRLCSAGVVASDLPGFRSSFPFLPLPLTCCCCSRPMRCPSGVVLLPAAEAGGLLADVVMMTLGTVCARLRSMNRPVAPAFSSWGATPRGHRRGRGHADRHLSPGATSGLRPERQARRSPRSPGEAPGPGPGRPAPRPGPPSRPRRNGAPGRGRPQRRLAHREPAKSLAEDSRPCPTATSSRAAARAACSFTAGAGVSSSARWPRVGLHSGASSPSSTTGRRPGGRADSAAEATPRSPPRSARSASTGRRIGEAAGVGAPPLERRRDDGRNPRAAR